MSAGNWVPELVDIAGGENVFGEAGKHSGHIDLGRLVAADPDVVAVMRVDSTFGVVPSRCHP